MKIKHGLTFDDVLLIPKYSEVRSRSDINLSVNLHGIKLKIPIVSANMRSITGSQMANCMTKLGGLALLHRFCNINEQLQMYKDASSKQNVGISIGVKEEDKERARILIENGCRIICIDVAHGHSLMAGDMTSYIAKTYPNIKLIAGNVCTADGANYLYDNGAKIIKVGIGNGSNCTTRIEAATGVPQMTALYDVYMAANGGDKKRFQIIADGGLRNAGDCVKSLVFADTVMLGSLLAGTNECPGQIQKINGKMVKLYEGSSTFRAKNIEGIKRTVSLRGPAEPIIKQLLEGISSGLSYQGCSDLKQIKNNVDFVQMTNAGLIESGPHGMGSFCG